MLVGWMVVVEIVVVVLDTVVLDTVVVDTVVVETVVVDTTVVGSGVVVDVEVVIIDVVVASSQKARPSSASSITASTANKTLVRDIEQTPIKRPGVRVSARLIYTSETRILFSLSLSLSPSPPTLCTSLLPHSRSLCDLLISWKYAETRKGTGNNKELEGKGGGGGSFRLYLPVAENACAACVQPASSFA